MTFVSAPAHYLNDQKNRLLPLQICCHGKLKVTQ